MVAAAANFVHCKKVKYVALRSSTTHRTKALRLKFIAERVPALQLDAMRMLLQKVRCVTARCCLA